MRASPLSIWYKQRRLSSKNIKKAPAGLAGAFLRLYLVGETGAHYRGGVTIYRDEQNCKTGMAARHKIGVFLQDECLQDRNGRVLSCGALWLQFWRDNAMTVSIEKLHEIIDLFAQFYALVRVGYQHTVGRHLYNLCSGLDVGTA